MSIAEPTITVITVCYNSAATIAETLRSVASQTWRAIEHIVIDGGSTDGTQALVHRHGRPGIVLVSESDDGIYDAMNKGLRLASGDWVGFLNADDVLADPCVLTEMVVSAQKTKADIVYGDLEYVVRANAQRVIRRWQSGVFIPAQLRRGWMPPHPTFYVRRFLVQRIGGFDPRFRIAADYDFMLRYLSAPDVKVVYLPRLMVQMKTGGVSGNGSLRAILQRNFESYKVLRKNRLGGLGALIWKNARKLPQLFR
ncbi:glycosyltransferase [Hylemonella gracilis]|uniref:Glycosyltransferase n=1 Tax=Hylemonella gracilis TaxID=80880 RepID=A0A4P6UJ33_9BURK|nr:glycosyltransferase family 2 protein [Hylemonella gracilis]QBK04424.1 glycosyltransferase [Hylemonella gracilis]